MFSLSLSLSLSLISPSIHGETLTLALSCSSLFRLKRNPSPSLASKKKNGRRTRLKFLQTLGTSLKLTNENYKLDEKLRVTENLLQQKAGRVYILRWTVVVGPRRKKSSDKTTSDKPVAASGSAGASLASK